MVSFINTWPIIVNGKPESVLQTIIRLGNKEQDLNEVITNKVDTGKIDSNGKTIWKWGAVEFVVSVSLNGRHKIIERPAA